MKKSLFLILSILSIFIFTDNVNALSFTATNGEEYTVDSEEKLLDYCYYNYYKGKTYKNLILAKDTTSYKCILVNHNTLFYDNSRIFDYTSSGTVMSYWYYTFTFSFNYSSGSTSKNTIVKNVLYSSTNLYSNEEFTDFSFTSNFTFNDIESKYGVIPTYTITYYLNNEVYKTFEVKEGTSHDLLTYNFNKGTHNFSGWSYDETIDLTNITSDISINATLTEKDVIPVYIEFPINKTEFYALLIEVGVLIIMLFLKWCFPFKGGSDLK